MTTSALEYLIIGVIGASNVGKTAVINRLNLSYFPKLRAGEYKATSNVACVYAKEELGDLPALFYEVGGVHSELMLDTCAKADMVLVVYNPTIESTIIQAEKYITTIRADEVQQGKATKTIVLVANTLQMIIEKKAERIDQLDASEYKFHISTETGQGIKQFREQIIALGQSLLIAKKKQIEDQAAEQARQEQRARLNRRLLIGGIIFLVVTAIILTIILGAGIPAILATASSMWSSLGSFASQAGTSMVSAFSVAGSYLVNAGAVAGNYIASTSISAGKLAATYLSSAAQIIISGIKSSYLEITAALAIAGGITSVVLGLYSVARRYYEKKIKADTSEIPLHSESDNQNLDESPYSTLNVYRNLRGTFQLSEPEPPSFISSSASRTNSINGSLSSDNENLGKTSNIWQRGRALLAEVLPRQPKQAPPPSNFSESKYRY